MRKTANSERRSGTPDGMRPEYRFDYRRARSNRFAARLGIRQRMAVMLDDDVAAVFTTPQSVNRALRALITIVPPKSPVGVGRR